MSVAAVAWNALPISGMRTGFGREAGSFSQSGLREMLARTP